MGVESIIKVENYINGRFAPTKPGNHIESFNPATGKVHAYIPDSTDHQVSEAVNAAETAFKTWSALDPQERAKYLFKIADGIEKRFDEFALAESFDQGKTVEMAKKIDIPRAMLNFRSYAEAWKHLTETSNVLPSSGAINYTLRQPIGVAGLISPWNLPLYLLTFKIAPAIMAGNTVVCKPSEMTSVTAWMLAQIMDQVGLPAGVVNLVFGYGHTCGEAIVRHPKVRIVSFTGSTGVGQHIASIAAPMMKKLSLELGGKNAAVIFDDANLEKCIQGVVRSSFTNQGEVCLCTSRIFVQQGIYERFLQRFVEVTKGLKVGDPLHPDTFMGAVNSRIHFEKIRSYIKIASEEGGTILTGQEINRIELGEENKGGWFIAPTIIVGLSDNSRCMQEEIFGPVTCVTPFQTENEVIDRVNNSRYGLCASVWSENVGVVHRMASKLEVGTVWANCWVVRSLSMPFGGFKESGSGREGVKHSLEAFTEEKTVCINTQ